MDPTPMSVETYLTTSFEPEAELADGVLVERNTGSAEHSRWQAALIGDFGARGREWGLRVRPILRIKTGETTFRGPDIALLDASLPREPIPTAPPVAIFEVLDPEDRFSLTMRRCSDFERMGVGSIYLIDPEDDSCTRYLKGSLYFKQQTITVADREIPFQAIIDELD